MYEIGTHAKGRMTFKAGKSIGDLYLFVALDGKHVIPVEGRKHFAIAVTTDYALANDPIAVQILGSNCGTIKVRAGGYIKAGDFLTANSLGRAVNYLKEEDTGTFPIYGIALCNATITDLVEFTPTLGLEKTK